MGTAIKHPVPDRVKPSFVSFDIQALWRPARHDNPPFFTHFKESLFADFENSAAEIRRPKKVEIFPPPNLVWAHVEQFLTVPDSRQKFQKLQMTASPGLIQDALQLYPYGNSGRQRVNDLIQVVTRTEACSTFGFRAFSAAGPRLWNSLPSHLKEAVLSYNRLRWSLKTLSFGL